MSAPPPETPYTTVVSGDIDRAASLLRAGELVAFPTDTVYGVGAIAWQPDAVSRLYHAKVRAADKAIPILLADLLDLKWVSEEVPEAALRLAARFWPGPLTLIVPRSARVPDEVTAGGDTVAVRVPDHPLAIALIRAAGAPLATTSANLSGAPSPVTASEVLAQLVGRIPLILDGGKCPGGVPSTVVDVTGPEPVVLRPGPITAAQVASAVR